MVSHLGYLVREGMWFTFGVLGLNREPEACLSGAQFEEGDSHLGGIPTLRELWTFF